MTEKLPNMMRAQNRVNSLIPDSSKLSRSISPKAAQKSVWLVSQRLKMVGLHIFSYNFILFLPWKLNTLTPGGWKFVYRLSPYSCILMESLNRAPISTSKNLVFVSLVRFYSCNHQNVFFAFSIYLEADRMNVLLKVATLRKEFKCGLHLKDLFQSFWRVENF